MKYSENINGTMAKIVNRTTDTVRLIDEINVCCHYAFFKEKMPLLEAGRILYNEFDERFYAVNTIFNSCDLIGIRETSLKRIIAFLINQGYDVYEFSSASDVDKFFLNILKDEF